MLAACSTPYPVPQVQFSSATAPAMPASGPLAWEAQQPLPVPAPPLPMVSGGIYRPAAYTPMFEDYRARRVGDILSIEIVETVSASQSSTSSLNKKGSVDGSVSAAPFVSPSFLGRLSASGSSANTFEGKGTTDTTNDFSGTITASVIGVLPNGHLLVAGEKQVGVNQNVDTLRFTGQVDPRTIQAGNVVASSKVANVRVQHKGEGAMGDTQGIGWLGRFFLNLLPI
jgi:flagellar L-ring protein FlgH